MKNNEPISDEVLNVETLTEIHKRFEKRDALQLLEEMLWHEPATYSYVRVCGVHIEDYMAKFPVPKRVAKQLGDEVIRRILVSIEAQRQAQYELWRDMMGDPAPEQPNPESDDSTNGGNHG